MSRLLARLLRAAADRLDPPPSPVPWYWPTAVTTTSTDCPTTVTYTGAPGSFST